MTFAVQDPGPEFSLEDSSLGDLLALPEEEALRRHLNGKNYVWLRRYGLGFSAVAFLVGLVAVIQSDYLGLISPVLNLILVRGLFVSTEKNFFHVFFRPVLLVYLLLQLSLVVLYSPQVDLGLELVGFLGPILFLTLRLRTVEYLLLFVPCWAGTLAWGILELPSLSSRLTMQSVATVICLYFAINSTHREGRRFLRDFRREVSRNRERLRMRQELDSARQIQLSMLPRTDPRIDGLDVSAISLPANEVGGDYYGYFENDSNVAVVVGDVAGHGVASALLLSGIRSCLYLLHEEAHPRPVEIMKRLNRMVQQTTLRRTFISLLYAVIDCPSRQLTVAGAGHPPLVHYSQAHNTLREVRQCALPLGTHLEASYGEDVVEFESGDVFVFYTDGLQEVVNHRGEPYGDQRLLRRIARAARSETAREIRETVLSHVWNFKGDAEQLDDITMVVVKVR